MTVAFSVAVFVVGQMVGEVGVAVINTFEPFTVPLIAPLLLKMPLVNVNEYVPDRLVPD